MPYIKFRKVQSVLLFLCLALVVIPIVGCSSNKSSSTVPIAVAVKAAAATIDQSQTDNITATVTNDSKNAGVTWTVSGGGALSGSTATATTFTAPGSVTTSFTATIAATSVTDTTKTASTQITVNPPPGAISVTQGGMAATAGSSYSATIGVSGGSSPFAWTISSGSLPAGLSLGTSTTSSNTISGTPTGQGSTFTVQATDAAGVATTQQFTITVALAVLTTSLPNGTEGTAYTATLQAAGGASPYSWVVTSGSLPQGLTLDSSTGVISGTPTETGTSSFTVTITDSQSATGTATLGITINAASSCTNNGNLKGSYAFIVQGWYSGQTFMSVAGSLVADGNGNITSGLADQNDATRGPQQLTSGTYCVGSNNMGTMSINNGNGAHTFAIVIQSDGNGSVIPYDATNANMMSGSFFKQDATAFSTSKFDGNFALGFVGVDASGNRYVMAGAFSSDGKGNLTNGELDAEDFATGATNTTFTATNFAVASTSRGTVTLNITNLGTGNFAFYVVDATHLLMIQTDALTGQLGSLFSGQVLQQSSLTGTDADLSGTSVYGVQQFDTHCTPACVEAMAGVLTADGAGNLSSYVGDDNDGGSLTNDNLSGTYSVASNGRVTTVLSGVNHPPILYLTGKNAGFITTSNKANFGILKPQSGGNFTGYSVSGNFYGGGLDPISPSVCEDVNMSTLTSGTSLTWVDDSICTSGPSNSNGASTFTVSSSGRGVITNSDQSQIIFYVVTPSSDGQGGEYITLPGQGSYPKIMTFQQ